MKTAKIGLGEAPHDAEVDNLDQVRALLVKAGQQIMHESNKIALSYRNKPLPNKEDADLMVKGLESALLNKFLNAFRINNIKNAKTYNKAVKCVCLDVLAAVEKFTNILPSSSKFFICILNNSSIIIIICILGQDVLTKVGGIWEKCEKLEQSLPLNPIEAVIDQLRREKGMINDAIDELNEALEDDEDDGWSEQVRQELIPPASALLKVALNLMKKLIGAMNKCELNAIEDCENVLSSTTLLSSHVDDFALTLYPPSEPAEVKEKSQTLLELLRTVLEHELAEKKNLFAKQEEMEKWRTFLIKALEHNSDKLSLYLTKCAMTQLNV